MVGQQTLTILRHAFKYWTSADTTLPSVLFASTRIDKTGSFNSIATPFLRDLPGLSELKHACRRPHSFVH